MLTRRELLRRAALLAAAFPIGRLPDAPDNTDNVELVQYPIGMYRVYPYVATGWICKACRYANSYFVRRCKQCGIIELAIPENWTCPDCKETKKWEEYCLCDNLGHSVQNKINPFWLG